MVEKARYKLIKGYILYLTVSNQAPFINYCLSSSFFSVNHSSSQKHILMIFNLVYWGGYFPIVSQFKSIYPLLADNYFICCQFWTNKTFHNNSLRKQQFWFHVNRWLANNCLMWSTKVWYQTAATCWSFLNHVTMSSVFNILLEHVTKPRPYQECKSTPAQWLPMEN